MNKPTFLLFMGIGWCGTTSLYNTLKVNKYLHSGWIKENHKLSYIENPDFVLDKDLDLIIDLSRNKLIPTINEVREYPLIKYDDYIKVLSKIPPTLEKDMDEFPTLEQYIEYYKILSDNRYPYHVVGDFSNTNIYLGKKFLIKLKSSLEEYFDIKVLYIHRDRVRSTFSQYNFLYYNRISKEKRLKYPTVSELCLDTNNFFKIHNHIEKCNSIFGKENIHHVIMEKFFIPDREEVSLLENFLNYKLSIIEPCCFVPDKGINAPKIEGLQDQWDSDHEILTEEIYTLMKEKMKDEYKYDEEVLFKNRLPEDWGKSIDYGY